MRLLAVLLLGAIMLSSCERQPDQNPVERRISGPVGLEYSVRPRFKDEGRMVIAGCCSFVLNGASANKLEGDVDGRELTGPSYRATITFGQRAIRFPPTHEALVRVVDDIAVSTMLNENARGKRPHMIATATVPLSKEAAARNIDFPQLEILGWCSDTASCEQLDRLVSSLRF